MCFLSPSSCAGYIEIIPDVYPHRDSSDGYCSDKYPATVCGEHDASKCSDIDDDCNSPNGEPMTCADNYVVVVRGPHKLTQAVLLSLSHSCYLFLTVSLSHYLDVLLSLSHLCYVTTTDSLSSRLR